MINFFHVFLKSKCSRFFFRAEYGEKTVQKLNLRIDNIMYDLVQEKTKTQTVNDELDQTFNLFVTHWCKLSRILFLSLILSLVLKLIAWLIIHVHYLASVLHAHFWASRIDLVHHTITQMYPGSWVFGKSCIDGRVAMFQVGNAVPIVCTTRTRDCIDRNTDCKKSNKEMLRR